MREAYLLTRAFLAMLAMLRLAGCASLPPRGPVSASQAFSPTELAGTRLARVVNASKPTGTHMPDGFRLLTSGEHAFDARRSLAELSERTIDAQYFHLHADTAGRGFLGSLRDAARRGVRVRLLVDDFYAGDVFPMLLELAAEPNLQVRTFNPLPQRLGTPLVRLLASAHDFGRVNRRMHNKLFLADGHVAIYGGRNVADEYFMSSTRANFVDLDVLAVGPQVDALSAIFDRFWNSEHVWPVERFAGIGAASRGAADMLSWASGSEPPPFNGDPEEPFGLTNVREQLQQGVLQLRWGRASVQADEPDKVRARTDQGQPSEAMSAKLELITRAEHEVLVMSPYFIPGEFGLRLIAAAAARGVRVNVFTNSLASTDVPLVHRAYSRYRLAMMRLGARLHELNPEQLRRTGVYGEFRNSLPRMHVKAAVVDKRWLLVGSVNLDPRSAVLNTEISVNIDCPDLAGDALTALGSPPWSTMFSLSIAEDGESVRWRALGPWERLRTFDTEPDDSVWLRFVHWLQSLLVEEGHL